MNSHERILVVDDEEQMRDLLAKVLERKGYQVSVCGDGVEALAFLEKEPADLSSRTSACRAWTASRLSGPSRS